VDNPKQPEPEPLTPAQRKELALDNVRKKSADFHTLFTSPVGEKVLKYLEDEFDKDEIFQVGDPHATAYMLGKRDVIVYIRQMIRVKENAR
jgi:hypothetical protein